MILIANVTVVLMLILLFRFMENLQTEVLELEFNEFARGMQTITEEEFAHILLRYTILSKEEHQEYIQRLRERIPHSKVKLVKWRHWETAFVIRFLAARGG